MGTLEIEEARALPAAPCAPESAQPGRLRRSKLIGNGMLAAGVAVTALLASVAIHRLTHAPQSLQSAAVTAPSQPRVLPRPAPAAPSAAPLSAPTTAPSVPLVLLGTFAQPDPARGRAIIGLSAQGAGLYVTGEEVAAGVMLREVYADHVVIERAGQREVLMITRSSGTSAFPGLAANAGDARPPPAGMEDTVRLASVPATDARQGVRVFPGRNRAGFAQLGLHAGDLLTEINGVPIAGQEITDLTSLLKAGGPTTVTVFRAGRLQQLVVRAPEDAGSMPAER